MATTDPLYIDASGGAPAYGAQEYRQGDTAIFAGPSSGQVFSGVRGGLVSVVGTTITIAPLTYILNGGNAPGSEGVYRGVFLAGDTGGNLSKTLTAAHSTLDRIDQIRVRVYNHDVDGSGRREHVIEYQAGTAGSGTPPTLPANSYEIARIAVPHTGAGAPSVTMTAKPPVAAGGARPDGNGGLEIYDFSTGTWKRVWETEGAFFTGGYDPVSSVGIANNTWLPMPITAGWDSSRVTLVGSNSLRIDEAGRFLCDAQVRIAAGSGSGTGRCRFTVNGAEVRQYNNPLGASALTLPLSCQLPLNVNDVLRFEVQQDSGGTRVFSNGVVWNFLDIARVS
jgi:hypothetical protein